MSITTRNGEMPSSTGLSMSKRKLGHRNMRDIVSEGLCGASWGTTEINLNPSVLQVGAVRSRKHNYLRYRK